MKRFGFALLASLLISQAFAQGAQKIAGIWWNAEKTSKIEIKEENGKFIGTVVYIVPEKYVNGQPPRDSRNRDASLRSRSGLGVQVLTGLKYKTSGKYWTGGRIYDPNTGKTHNCYAWFSNDPNALNLKGYIVGLKWLGKSTTWTRTTR